MSKRRKYKSSLKARLRAKKWYEENTERALASARRWELNNPEKCKISRVKRKEQISGGKKRWYARNKGHVKAKSLEWGSSNRERRREISRDYARKKRLDRFGLSKSGVEKILQAQNGACKICKICFTDRIKPCLDHCHKTETFRGFLCQKCNAGLGMFRDSAEFLQEAIKYLREASHV